MNHTHVQYVGLAQAFDLLNSTLFDSELPSALVTLQRHAGSRGYYLGGAFSSRDAVHETATDEIALNPDAFRGRSDRDIFSTLAHEMCHLWECRLSTPPKGGYHSKKWAAKMQSIGLMPSDTGEPGGKTTGPKMTHYIIEGGAFERAYAEIEAAGVRIQWESAPRDETKAKKKAKSKTKFTCASCEQNAWGKPDIQITCTPCDMPMLAEDGESEGDANA